LGKKSSGKKSVPRKTPPTTGERIAGIGSDAVRNATGKGWSEWLAILDREEAGAMTHQEIARLLYQKHGVPGWWAQMITVGYEQARGLRAKHQKPGGFEIGRSKTIAAPVDAVFAAWNDARQRARWLADPKITIRTATPGRSLRVTWVDGTTNLVVDLSPRSETKTVVSVQHGKLRDARAAKRMKTYWAAQLERLKTFLEP
jgi:uncharacterized protein YndB with AHSA1/START domain